MQLNAVFSKMSNFCKGRWPKEKHYMILNIQQAAPKNKHVFRIMPTTRVFKKLRQEGHK